MKSLLLLSLLFFLDTVQSENKISKLSPVQKKSRSREKNKTKSCNQSGKMELYSEKNKFKPIDIFFNNKMDSLADKNFFYMKKKLTRQCPKHCQQINNYKIISKISPIKTIKGSCKKKESQEVYTLKKSFPLKPSQSSNKKSHQNMKDWIFSLFIYPYYPFSKTNKEYADDYLLKACPSCSFYIDYHYIYTKNSHLDVNLTARCGDRRYFFSDFQTEISFVNHWLCKKAKT